MSGLIELVRIWGGPSMLSVVSVRGDLRQPGYSRSNARKWLRKVGALAWGNGEFSELQNRLNTPEAIAKGTEHLRAVVDASMAEELLQPYTATEVKKALFQMAPLKSPRPDAGPDSTHLVLIPKYKNSEFLTQFRPISLCNVVYKIASKVIANRLKVFLDRIISPAQSAFVPRRLISDNVLLAFELNHFLNTKTRGEQGWMALKLDVSKAYDKVEWSFLEQVMSKLGGTQFGSLVPKRDSARGTLSRLIFFYYAQSLSVISYKTRKEKGAFGVSRSVGALQLSFTSYLLMIRSSLVRLPQIIDRLFVRNTREEVCQSLAAELTIRRENKLELYLGLPTRVARSKRDLFATIRDRIWQKITGWNDKLLSQAGKEILIKAVLQAVPSYAMGCFRLPASLSKELQGMISRFWWSSRGKNKTHWVSWNRLCESKLLGGLGFRHLHLFNLAMLAKQLWRIMRHPDCLLSRVLRAGYFPSGDIFSATLGSRPSFTWRSVMAAYDLFRAGCRWRVGIRYTNSDLGGSLVVAASVISTYHSSLFFLD
ncbi:putative mitochondrial protein [Sesamum angolense]|uniref:Mitochondrial protein n=1 Tax=Sesamum angolense TaxID=2727404 RepID=A0AAE1WB79_9LAMI|nr:putative mitochondrial protein [Sesamum angolense]